MPEYLSPGVYVEERDTGSKPIEGVSTSTAGVVGVTERGPVNVPILITSFGEFTRWFGEYLNRMDFPNADDDRDNERPHRFLPHAVQGFFVNGGKRLYVVRILDTEVAQNAELFLFDRGTDPIAISRIVQNIEKGTDKDIHIISDVDILSDKWVRIGNDSNAEYRKITQVDPAIFMALSFPIQQTHQMDQKVHTFSRVPILGPTGFGGGITLDEGVEAGGHRIVLRFGTPAEIINLKSGQLLEIGGENTGEHHFVSEVVDSADPALATVTLGTSLARSYSADLVDPTVIVPLDVTTGDDATIMSDTRSGATLLFVDSAFESDSLIVINNGEDDNREVRRIGQLSEFTVTNGAYETYPANSMIEKVEINMMAGTIELTEDARAGSSVITANSREGLEVGATIQIGGNLQQPVEYLTIESIVGLASDEGKITFYPPLVNNYLIDTEVTLINQDLLNPDQPVFLVLGDDKGKTTLMVTANTGYVADDFIRVTTPEGKVFYHRLSLDPIEQTTSAVTLEHSLENNHFAGAGFLVRDPMVTVQALDQGGWGNRLQVAIRDEDPGLMPNTNILSADNDNEIELASINGIETGTVLEMVNPVDGSIIDKLLKVESVNRTNNKVVLSDKTRVSQIQISAIENSTSDNRIQVRSREFQLIVELLHQPDPVTPSRNDTVIQSEIFRNLSMDHRHSRYIETVIGKIDREPDGSNVRLSDRRTDGESWLIRARDLAVDDAARKKVRVGPDILWDVLPDGRRLPSRRSLRGGNDAVSSISDGTYVGTDDQEPEVRTGLFSLKNEDNISIIACPGRTSQIVQQALINQCQQMKFRFAVLDGPPPPRDSLNAVQAQRQSFDTKYAALYHPWLLTFEPFPINPAQAQEYPIPPSGHIIGVYARTDIEKGVHKAPANEVVRGIMGLRRILNKSEHDILNPYPVNINVIRDFRPNNRGIRVWGGRVITSDSDWKYVNVRRLFIFLESSIERGLQWVVFEPNAEPLWARVRRTISNFLTQVWRNGALEGTKTEEAFFVKCDRTTMTQTDIDNGRLICVIGVASVKPCEYAIIQIGLWTAHAESE